MIRFAPWLLIAVASGCSASHANVIPPAGASHGDWVDYYRDTYPDRAKLSDRASCNPRPWPKDFDLESNPIFAHNEVLIDAPPERVFAVLVDANHWADFYENAREVKLLPDASGATPAVLQAGTHFTWSTFGASLETFVTEYEQDRVLGWTCRGGTPTIAAHHRWLLVPEGNGTRLITEELNNPEVTVLIRWFIVPIFKGTGHGEALPAAHQHWLEQLKKRAETPAANASQQ